MSELVFTRNGPNNERMIGGYMVPETLGSVTFNGKKEEDDMQSGGNVSTVSSIFKGLAVPAGLFLMQQSVSDKPVTNSIQLIKQNVVENSLYDNLLDMATLKNKRKFIKKTRRVKKNTKKTRKSRKQ